MGGAEARPVGAARGDIDDGAGPFLLDQAPREGLENQEWSFQVGLKDSVPVRLVHLQHTVGGVDSGIVDQDIETVEPVPGRRQTRGNGLRIADVESQSRDLLCVGVECRHRPLDRLPAQVGQGDSRALVQESLSDRKAKSHRCAGHQDFLSVEPFGHCVLQTSQDPAAGTVAQTASERN